MWPKRRLGQEERRTLGIIGYAFSHPMSSILFLKSMALVLGDTARTPLWYVVCTYISPQSTHTWLGDGAPEEDGYIEPSKPREEVRQDPYPLPKDFEWSTLDITDPVQVWTG